MTPGSDTAVAIVSSCGLGSLVGLPSSRVRLLRVGLESRLSEALSLTSSAARPELSCIGEGLDGDRSDFTGDCVILRSCLVGVKLDVEEMRCNVPVTGTFGNLMVRPISK